MVRKRVPLFERPCLHGSAQLRRITGGAKTAAVADEAPPVEEAAPNPGTGATAAVARNEENGVVKVSRAEIVLPKQVGARTLQRLRHNAAQSPVRSGCFWVERIASPIKARNVLGA